MKQADLILYAGSILTCAGNGKPKTGGDLSDVGLIRDGGIAVSGEKIEAVGSRKEIVENYECAPGGKILDTGECCILPGFVDSHTHPVFAGNRVNEFILRSKGATYQEIHAAGGGIGFTVEKTRIADDEELYRNGSRNLLRMLGHGTTTVEAKSGYGLETGEELRELRIIGKLGRELPLEVVPTFMGAHSIPGEYLDRRDEYVNLIIEEMLPAVREKNLAEFVDVFCEQGAFTPEETERILTAAKDLGFSLKLHSEEFSNLGSARLAGRLGAVSVDHLLKISDDDIIELAKTGTMLTLMPGTLFFLNMKEYAPARKIIDLGAKIALATDFNAGSCMSGSMQMAVSLACIAMGMSPGEAINAATYNASFALGRDHLVGSIEPGKQADIVVFDMDDYRLIPYHFGLNLVKTVIKKGRIVVERVLGMGKFL